ncbi:MAG: hydrogenase maturation nickel metallochaperone HypA [Sandaracinaceae bacterium]
MHELSITRNIVAICAERAGARSVRSVTVQVGRLAGIEVDALRFCFDLCAEGTPLEGAKLIIDEVEGRGECLACGEVLQVSRLVAVCPCERRGRLRLTAGQELLIREMEV